MGDRDRSTVHRRVSRTSRDQHSGQQSHLRSKSTNKSGHSSAKHTGQYDVLLDSDRYSDYEGSDEDFEFPANFDETKTRKALLKSENCAKIVLSLEQQRDMGLEIGVNVTAEHPWKQIRIDILGDYLSAETPESAAFRQKLDSFGDDKFVLVGYAAALSEDVDTFLFFETSAAAEEASVLIGQIEAAERRKARRAQVKHPRKWKSFGSEVEVDIMTRKKREDVVEVEIQSLYPMGHPHKAFQMRRSTDVRDGYVELVPRKPQDFQNVCRKRVDTVMQSAEPRVNLEQQTDPTFPTNAWSQYLYEIGQDKVEEPLDEDDEDEPQRKKRGANVEPVIPVIPSDRVDQMLESLEFNEVNMYRNDYQHISDIEVSKFKVPYLRESFCFVNLAKSIGRYVTSIDWHPLYSGLVLAAYTFSTSSTLVSVNNKTDTISRTVLQPNPVLLWSFDDTLCPKLELYTAREITCISFCPYDDQLVVGGTVNGQLIIWDLKGRIHKVESDEVLTAAQAKYRVAMQMFLDWTKQDEADRIVRPVALSNMQNSHKSAITSIKWLSRDCYVAANGNVKLSKSGSYRFFATASLDCSIAFWDMDFVDELEAKKPSGVRKLKLPAHMVDKPSEYERLHKVFRPLFVAMYNQPVNGLLMDGGVFRYVPLLHELRQPRQQSTRVKHKTVYDPTEVFDDHVIVGTMNGTVARLKWDGSELTANDIIKRETIKNPEFFAQLHDGSIEAIHENPFLTDLFLTVGRNVLVLWRKELLWTAVFWRRCPIRLTDVKWSKDRASVFFVTRADGSFEAWDLLSRTDAPCLVDSLGGDVLTKLSQHKLTTVTEVVAIGDFNSSLRFLEIPSCFTKPIPNDLQLLDAFVHRELERKEVLQKWQIDYYNSNADIRAAKLQAVVEAQLEAERLEKEFREQEELRLRREETEARKAYKKLHNKAIFDMPDLLERRWDEMNIKRLTKKLMAMKQVDPALLAKLTKPEKDRLKYCALKRQAVEDSFARVSTDMAELRAKLIPAEVVDEGRVQFVKENLSVIRMDDTEDMDIFGGVESKALQYINKNPTRDSLDYAGILRRGRQRREVINMSLGANAEHRRTYYGGSIISDRPTLSAASVASVKSALQGGGDNNENIE